MNIFKKIKTTVTLLILFSLVPLWSGCSRKGPAGPPQRPPTNVVGFKTEQKDLSDTISMVGTLQANESVNIKSEIDGLIEKINFQEGQHVHKGDVLFQVEKNKLQAAYEKAEANLKLAETTAKRYENLVKSQAVSQQEYDETVATLQSNRAAVALAKEQLEDATILAPFDGVMGERLVSVGQYISQGTQLSSIYNQDPIKAEFHVPERYLSDVKLGQTVKFKVAAYKDTSYDGKVYFIDPKIDTVTRTALVKAHVANPEGELREGMFANVELIVSVSKDAVVIPEAALIVKGDDVFVYVVKDDQTVELRPVTTGKRFEGLVVIDKGLAKGEVIVTEGYQKIGPGSKVNVRFEDSSKKKLYEII